MMNTFTAVVHKEKGLYVAECPEIGTASQGVTIEEAVSNLQEATELYLEEFPVKQTFRPFLTTFEVTAHGWASKKLAFWSGGIFQYLRIFR
jgi:predicted RNase H-like HicB family nuclease